MPDERLQIDAVIDLDDLQGRAALLRACGAHDELRRLVEDNTDDYLRWFEGREWRRIYSGGLVGGPRPTGGSGSSVRTIPQLLEITAKLRELSEYEGFNTLVGGLRNPRQVDATVFEIEAASWCSTRTVHERLAFSPEVDTRSGIKRPDFRWTTALGTLCCECKSLQQWESAQTRRVGELLDVAVDAMTEAPEWPEDLRLDVVVDGRLPQDSDARLRGVVHEITRRVGDGERDVGVVAVPFAAVVRPRAEEPPELPDVVTAARVVVSRRPTKLSHENASVTVSRSLERTRHRAVNRMVKDAKTQLPDDEPGAVLLQMGGHEAAARRLKAMLQHPAHVKVVWASVWSGGALRQVVWQIGQPFDDRLLG